MDLFLVEESKKNRRDLKVKMFTLPETNIAHENHHFSL